VSVEEHSELVDPVEDLTLVEQVMSWRLASGA
jgi:hypothetical protein